MYRSIFPGFAALVVLGGALNVPVAGQSTCDLAAARASIQMTTNYFQSGGRICATFKNTSSTCTFPVAVEAFALPLNQYALDYQIFLDASVTQLGPGQTATLCATPGAGTSNCSQSDFGATQVDAFLDAQGSTVLPVKVLTQADYTVGNRVILGRMVGCFACIFTPPPQDVPSGCTFTQGYFKNHVQSICTANLQVGSVMYSKADLINILQSPVQGNCLLSLAHQLITAQLNRICKNASVPSKVSDAIAQANTLIGSTDLRNLSKDSSTCNSTVSNLIDTLTAFNEGQTGPGHCAE